MRLSATDVYAFQALGFLGLQDAGRWVASEEISEATGIHRPYLVRILAALSAKGVVKSKKGIGGGYALARKPQQVFSRDVLLEEVWGYRHAADTRLVNVHVQRLRSKIERDPEHPEIVVTVRGIGYKAGETVQA